MKRLLLLLFIFLPFLSGCTTIDANLTINNNKSAKIDIKIESKSDADPLEMSTIVSNVKKFSDKKYKITNNSSKDKVSILARKNVKNLIDEDLDLSSLGFTTQLPSERFIDVKRNFFVTSYNINMVYNLKKQKDKVILVNEFPKSQNNTLKPEYLQFAETFDIDDNSSDKIDFLENFDENLLTDIKANEDDSASTKTISQSEYKMFDINGIDAVFSISLPYFASYNNADKNIGTVYYWNLNKNGPTQIKMQYVVYSSFAIWSLILIGILMLVYLAFRIHRHDVQKRIGNNN